MELLEKERLNLISADRYWMVEHAFFAEMSTDEGEGRYGQKILQVLPTKTKAVTFQQALDQLRALKASALGRFCNRVVASNLDTILGWAASGKQRQMIKMPRADGGLLKLARQQFGFFFRATFGSTADGMGKVEAYGRDAAERLLASLDAKEKAGNMIQLGDIQDLVVFNFLLTEDERKKVSCWAEKRLTADTSKSGITAKAPKKTIPSEAAVSQHYFKKST